MKKHGLVDQIPVYEEKGVYNFYLKNKKPKPEKKEEQKKTATKPTAMDVSAVGSSASTYAAASAEAAAAGADGWQTVFRRHARRR